MSSLLRRAAPALALLLLPLAGCADPAGPRALHPTDVAAEYGAAAGAGTTAYGSFQLTTTERGVSVNHAALGAEVRLLLRADGTTAGRLVIPETVMEGEGVVERLEADLVGTWTLTGNVITLAHAADTFLRDMPLTVRGDRLEGDRTFDGVRVRLVLQRQ